MGRLKVAIIGTGMRSISLMGQLDKLLLDNELTSVCDLNLNRLSKFVAKLRNPPGIFHSVDEMLEAEVPDAAFVTVPDFAHVEVSVKLLRAGVSIYLEKPMARNTEECRAILEAEANSNAEVVLGFNLRSAEFYQKVREVWDSGILGQVIHISASEHLSNEHSASFSRRFHRKRKYNGGFLNAKCSHDLDLFNWLIGTDVLPAKVSSFGGTNILRPERAPAERCSVCPSDIKDGCLLRAPEGPSVHSVDGHDGSDLYPGDLCAWTADKDIVDNQTVMIEYRNGIRVQFSVNMFAHKGDRTITIIGDKGRLSGSLAKGEMELIGSSDGDRTIIETASKDGSHGGGDARLVEDFVNIVLGKEPNRADSSAGYLATLLAEKSDQSMREGRTITFSAEDYAGITVAG